MLREMRFCQEIKAGASGLLFSSSATSDAGAVTEDGYSSGQNVEAVPASLARAVAALPPAPQMYRHVLRLLRDAETSCLWPASSISRRNVIDGRSKRGESFAMGRMPQNLPQPRANAVFPELLQACIALEHASTCLSTALSQIKKIDCGLSFCWYIIYWFSHISLSLCNRMIANLVLSAWSGIGMPLRPASSSIVINKHAQFKPHKDSGAGAGQGTSMIVGLGDFSGGELVPSISREMTTEDVCLRVSE